MHQRIIFVILMFSSMVLAQESPHKQVTHSCDACHVTENWHTIHFDHDQTAFSLTGEHRKLKCTSCHILSDFKQVQSACNRCHTDVHKDRLYPECDRCHTTISWIVMDAYRAHSSTSLQLIGRHAALDCRTCHRGEVEGEWRRLTSNCSDCHRKDYLAASDPVHDDLGFGLVCEDCHSPITWKPASFEKHDSQYFPIFSGEHAGRWENCTTCHYVQGNYGVFSCFENCHEHSKSKTDSKHHEVSAYRYDSNACYDCHHNGKGGD